MKGSTLVKTDSRFWILIGLCAFLALFAGGGTWLYAANIAGAVIAPGTVAIQGKPKTIQHLDGGIVSQIKVADGDRVEAGDVLVQLDPTLLNVNLQIYRNRVREVVAQRSRLIAERDGLQKITWDESLLVLLGLQQNEAIRLGHQRLFDARRTAREGQIEQLNERISQFESQIDGVNALKASKGRQIELISDELSSVTVLKEKGLATNAQVIGLEREKENLTGQIGEHDADLARISNSINESKIQILQIERDARQSVLAELREVELELNEVSQQLHATVERLKRVDIKAPAGGIIHEMSVFTIGGVVGPGETILQIIPQKEQLVVETRVEPQFIDEVFQGQAAAMRFSAFNQRTTPELNGVVDGISANIVVDELTGAPFYKVTLVVPQGEMERLNGLELIPGMPVESFIKTRDRSALNYLIKPLLDQASRAFRED